MLMTTSDMAIAHSMKLPARALVVEDNMVVALDMAEILEDAGVSDIRVAATVEQGLSFLDESPVDFALLDVNLGTSTSLEVAKVLASRGVPFILTTGYEGASGMTDGFPPSPILVKPYSPSDIVAAVADLFGL